ncbi:MAG TPA: hypothetical protein H9679_00705 [Firmicutes bacterium]|nr:hypothetical protein [Bacillota bacterium]
MTTTTLSSTYLKSEEKAITKTNNLSAKAGATNVTSNNGLHGAMGPLWEILLIIHQGIEKADHLLWDGFLRLLHRLGRDSLKFFPQDAAQGVFQFFLSFSFQNSSYQKGAFLAFRHSLQQSPCLAVVLILEVWTEHKKWPVHPLPTPSDRNASSFQLPKNPLESFGVYPVVQQGKNPAQTVGRSRSDESGTFKATGGFA